MRVFIATNIFATRNDVSTNLTHSTTGFYLIEQVVSVDKRGFLTIPDAAKKILSNGCFDEDFHIVGVTGLSRKHNVLVLLDPKFDVHTYCPLHRSIS